MKIILLSGQVITAELISFNLSASPPVLNFANLPLESGQVMISEVREIIDAQTFDNAMSGN